MNDIDTVGGSIGCAWIGISTLYRLSME